MTYEDVLNLIDLITEIAVKEVERSALDSDHWEQADYLTHQIHVKRHEAADRIVSMITEKGPLK